MAVTVRTLESAKPQASAYKITVERGLYLRVAIDGTKTWLIRYVVDGKQRQARLPKLYGQGPGLMTLAQARTENARIQAMARDDIDFQEKAEIERKAQAAAKAREHAADLPLSAMFTAWVTDGVTRANNNEQRRTETSL